MRGVRLRKSIRTDEVFCSRVFLSLDGDGDVVCDATMMGCCEL